MDVYRFVIKAYPAKAHPKFYEWQKASLLLFVGAMDPLCAQQIALSEVKCRRWIPEKFEDRSTLIRSRVLRQGGEVWDAYAQAEQGEVFFDIELESPAICTKGQELWGTGPELSETFVDSLIEDAGGHRVTAEEADDFKIKNADYVLGRCVFELKQFEKEGLEVKTRQKKIGDIFERYYENEPVCKIDPSILNEKDYIEYCEIVGVPIQKRVKAANKQVKSTLAHMDLEGFSGGVILLNTGYLTMSHDLLVERAERYASKDTSSINYVVVISSWTTTNGFDNQVSYAFHPNNPSSIELKNLQAVFWEKIEGKMTGLIAHGLHASTDVQKPMTPTYFEYKEKVFIFGIPQTVSSFY